MSTGAVTSANAGINAESLTSSVTITSATAKTALLAKSQSALTLGAFTVSAGGATLTAGTDYTTTTGTAYGPITVTMGGIGSLGTLTSSNSTISATSTLKGMSFTALKAATGITLRAKANMGTGTNANYAFFGTSLDAGTGGVDAQTDAGSIQIGKLTAKTASIVKTSNGNLKITTITLPSTSLMTATATGGTKTLPTGY
jgi:hypothetical protein